MHELVLHVCHLGGHVVNNPLPRLAQFLSPFCVHHLDQLASWALRVGLVNLLRDLLPLGRDVRLSPARTRFSPPFRRRRQCSRRVCFLHRHRPAIPPGFRLHQSTTNKMARPNPRTAGNLNHLHLLCTPWNCFRRLLRLAREASSACSHAQAHLRLQPRPATDHQCPGLVGTILYFINKLHVVPSCSCRRTNERRNWHELKHFMKRVQFCHGFWEHSLLDLLTLIVNKTSIRHSVLRRSLS